METNFPIQAIKELIYFIGPGIRDHIKKWIYEHKYKWSYERCDHDKRLYKRSYLHPVHVIAYMSSYIEKTANVVSYVFAYAYVAPLWSKASRTKEDEGDYMTLII